MLYPSIDTLFNRDFITHKLVAGDYKDEIFSLIREWEWTEKVDGTNIRVMYYGDPSLVQRAGNFRWDFLKGETFDLTKLMPFEIGGRTEKADLGRCAGVVDYIQSKLTTEKLYEIFGHKNAVIFGEGYGDKIQGGSGYIAADDPVRQKFIVFDILVGDKYWLKREDVVNICEKLGLDVVPLIDGFYDEDGEVWGAHYDFYFIDHVIKFVEEGFKSKLGDGTKDAEGLVGRTKIPLFDAKGRRIIVKLRTEDFAGTIGKGKKGA